MGRRRRQHPQHYGSTSVFSRRDFSIHSIHTLSAGPLRRSVVYTVRYFRSMERPGGVFGRLGGCAGDGRKRGRGRGSLYEGNFSRQAREFEYGVVALCNHVCPRMFEQNGVNIGTNQSYTMNGGSSTKLCWRRTAGMSQLSPALTSCEKSSDR